MALVFPLLAAAQDDEKFSDRLFFGGSLGFQFGSYTYVDVSPMVGYHITDRLSGGLSATYIYYNVDDPGYYNYSSHVYGGSIFTRFMVTNDFFAHAELELLNMDIYDPFYIGRQTIPSLLLGGGYRMAMGSRASMSFLVLFDVIEDRYSPYINPVMELGVGIGF